MILFKHKSDHITPLFMIFPKDFLSFWTEPPAPDPAPGPVWRGPRLPFQLSSCRLPFPGFQFACHPLVLEPQAQCCCEAFAVAVPSARNSLFPDLQAASSFWALRPQLTWPLLEKPSSIASSEAAFIEPRAQPSHSPLHYHILVF